MKNVVIYRAALLPVSETFVLAQAKSLRSFRPQFVALQPARNNLSVPADAIYLSRRRSILSRARRGIYDFTGIAPHFHKKVRDISPVLIHAHFATDGTSAMALAASIKAPLLVTLHGYDVATEDAYWLRSVYGRMYMRRRRKLWNHALTFVCVSKFIRDMAIRRGFPAERLCVHYIGIDRAVFHASPRPRERVVLFVGRLVPMKGCEFLLKAMRLVQSADPSIKLVVIGDGYLRAELENLAGELRLNCEFLGSLPSPVVREWMSRARILCAPSVTAPNGESEGLGIVILEAQAVGTPVVGFRTGGIPEAVDEGRTGLLAQPEDINELSHHMQRYFNDDDFWQESSSRAIAWVAEHFDIATQTTILEEIYEEVIARGPRSS